MTVVEVISPDAVPGSHCLQYSAVYRVSVSFILTTSLYIVLLN